MKLIYKKINLSSPGARSLASTSHGDNMGYKYYPTASPSSVPSMAFYWNTVVLATSSKWPFKSALESDHPFKILKNFYLLDAATHSQIFVCFEFSADDSKKEIGWVIMAH